MALDLSTSGECGARPSTDAHGPGFAEQELAHRRAMSIDGNKSFLTLDEAAELMRLSVDEVYARVREGQYFGLRLGSRGPWRVLRDSLPLDEHRAAP